MKPKVKLTEARKRSGFSQQEIAELCNMDQTTYSKKERGISPVNETEWQKFAEILNVKEEEIKEEELPTIINENCTFNDHNFSTNINYINIPQDILDMLLKYNKKLEEENIELKKNQKTV